MPEHLAEINLGSWAIRVFTKASIAALTRSEAPRLSATYIVHKKSANYVGQSIDVLWRLRCHVTKALLQDDGETVAVIFNTDIAMDRELLIHIEFGLMLTHLGCDHRLVTKQADVPFGNAKTRQRALSFFETILCHYRLTAIPLFGSHSARNRRSLEDALTYLRMIWTDTDDASEDHVVADY